MSLFQACKQATSTSRRLVLRNGVTFSRSLAVDSVSSPPETSKKDTEIIAPAQDVMVAEVISGAPGADLANLL